MGVDTGLTISIHEAPSSMILPDHQSAIKRLAAEKPILEFQFLDDGTTLFGQDKFPKAIMFRQIAAEDMWDDLDKEAEEALVVNMKKDGPWWTFFGGDANYAVRGHVGISYYVDYDVWERYSATGNGSTLSPLPQPYLYHPCRYIEFMEKNNVAGGIWDNMEAFNVLRSIEAFALLTLYHPGHYDEKVMNEHDKPRTSLLRIPKGWSPLSAAHSPKKATYLTAYDFSPHVFWSIWLRELKVDGEKTVRDVESLVSTMRALQKRVKSGESTIMTQFLIDVNLEGHKFRDIDIEDRPFIDGRQKSLVVN